MRRLSVRLLLLVLSFLALPPAAARAQGAKGVIEGRVIQAATQQPISDASIGVTGDTRVVRSAVDGRFRIEGVAPGVVSLQARAIGYAPLSIADVVVTGGKSVEVTVRLSPAAVALSTVQVQASYFSPATDAPVSTQTLGREETRRAPGVQEDVIRAVALLPGVAVTQAGRNDLAVRGGAPYQNLFTVDGIEVPNINHFGSQGSTGGPLSLINIQFVDEVRFSAGGFGARYGDRTNSVTSLSLREGSRTFGGELNLSATGYGAFVEGPMGKDGTFLFGARRSYLDLVFKAAGLGFIPAYTDLTFKATRHFGARSSLSFLTVGALDNVTFNNESADNRYDNARVAANNQDQYFSGLTWRQLLGSGSLDVGLGRTWSRYETLQNDSLGRSIFRANTTEGENTLRADAQWTVGHVDYSVGASVRGASKLRYDLALPGFVRRDAAGIAHPLTLDTSFTAWREAAYAQASWHATRRFSLTGGARIDAYNFAGDASRFGPRLSARYELDPRTAVTLASGRYWQAPQYLWLVGDTSNRSAVRPFRADQLVLGVTRELRPDLKVQAEAYVQWSAELPGRLWRPQAVLSPAGFDDVTADIPFGLEPLRSVATGRSSGIELLAQKKLSRVPVYALATISINRTELTSLDGIARPGAFETKWIANLLGGWRPNSAWEVSGKIRAAAGLPTTPYVTGGPFAGTLDYSRYNAGPRQRTFFALDLRADRRWTVGGHQLITYIDVQNATGRQNGSREYWDPRTTSVQRDKSLGVLPSIGVNWAF